MKPIKSLSHLIINYSNQEYSELFEYNLETRSYHTDIIDDLQIKLHIKCVAFISTEPHEINYISIVKKSIKVASQKSRIRIDNILKLRPSISINDINEDISLFLLSNELNHITSIDNKLWDTIVAKINSTEYNKNLLKELFSYFEKQSNKYNRNEEEINGFEKDSLAFILKCSGFDQYKLNLSKFDIQKDNTPSFLKSLDKITVREDIMIIHDSNIFDDWKIIDNNLISTTLSDGYRKLSILYSNRLPLEETLGVDLIYIDETNKTIVMVQYKRLTGDSTLKYYPSSDKNYKKEIETMLKIKKILNSHSHGDYRFNDDAFYFKLCKAIQPSKQRDLIDGMYIPISYWTHLIDNHILVGRKGGISFSYESVPKYFNNTTFINLLKTGFIGCRDESFEYLLKIFEELYRLGNSIILAKVSEQNDIFA
jgi:hypothetical protein